MKIRSLIASVGAAAIMGGSLMASPAVAAPRGDCARPDCNVAAAAPTANASQEMLDDIIYQREGERLARDLYTALNAKHGGNVRQFTNISRSEQRHFDAVGVLIQRYNLDDPSAGATPGRYADPELQALYDRLLAQGSKSLQAAFEAGVAYEKHDIAELNAAIDRSTDPYVTQVFTNLRDGAENHLAAFERGASRGGQAPGQGRGRWQQAGGNQQGAGQGQQGRGNQGKGNKNQQGQGQGQGKGQRNGGGQQRGGECIYN